jgi:shikimate kinase
VADGRHGEAIDTDELVATSVGTAAAQYLREEGEANFRAREVEALREALERDDDVVVATGGGIVCSPDARAALSEEFTLWLDCDDVVILARLGDLERPLLSAQPAEALSNLRREREAWYRQVSRARIDTSTSIADAVAQVKREVDRLTR